MLEESLLNLIFSHQSTPQLIVKSNTPHFTIIASNIEYSKTTHLSSEAILGKTIWELFEKENKGIKHNKLILDGLNKALHTRELVKLAPLRYDIFGADGYTLEQRWWQPEYIPIVDKDSDIEFLLIITQNVTDQILSLHAVEKAQKHEDALQKEQALNQELVSANNKLEQSKASLKELTTEKENQVASKTRELLVAHNEAESQRDRLKRLFMQAPAAICIVDGPEMVFELVNPLYQQFFPDRELLGKPVLEALPEVKGPILDILQQVYNTGKTYEGNELLIPLARADNAPLEDRYFNFIYQARLNYEKAVDGILVFAFEVTEQVNSRKELQKAEESLRMATDSAELGTWNLNAKTHEFTASPRLNQIFGFDSNEIISYEDAFSQIREDYQPIVADAVDASIKQGVSFNMEYPVIGYHNQKISWVRSLGKLNYDKDGKANNLTGVLNDITERKQDELRKNDFIGMVSHELKTPLTSLNGYVQVLQARAKIEEDNFSMGALDKVNKQVKKMTAMINGFLNVSRLESGKISITKSIFNLDQLIKESIDEARLLAPSFTVNLAPCVEVSIFADYDKINAVVSNLLSNAIKYSPNGKTIIVTCEVLNGKAQISVKDQGIGIQSTDIPKLFERYYRVENPKTNTISGFGIGLYLCAEIIQRHAGEIWAESEPGKGSTFFFRLPLDN